MGKRKEYRKIIKNYKEQKIVFQEEMKLDYSKLEETIVWMYRKNDIKEVK